MINVVCTKCGTANQVQFTGYRTTVRCMSCNKLMSIGGKERGLKALPLQEISVVLGIAFFIAAVVTIVTLRGVVEDPLKKHRLAINKVALGIVKKVAKSEWQDVSILYVRALFNNQATPTLACSEMAYHYTDAKGFGWTIVVPMKFVRKKPETEADKDKILWDAKAIGVVDPVRVRRLEKQREKASRTEMPPPPVMKAPLGPGPGGPPKGAPGPLPGNVTPGPAPKGGPPALPGPATPGPAPKDGPAPAAGNVTPGPAPKGGPPAAEKPKPQQPIQPESAPEAPEPGDLGEEEEGLKDDGYTDECDSISEDWQKYRWFPFDPEKHTPILHGRGGEEFLREIRK